MVPKYIQIEIEGEEDDLEEQIQDHYEEVNSAINVEPNEDQDILPLIAHFTSSEAFPSNLDNEDESDSVTNDKEQSSDVTILDMDNELDSEATTSDLRTANAFTSSNMESETNTEKIPSSSKESWGEYFVNTVSKWFSNKEIAEVHQNRSDSFRKSNDNIASQTIDQHFLTTRPPRTEIP